MTRLTLARHEDLLPGEMAGMVVGQTPVLLVNVGGTVYAYLDSCPHRGVPLSRGRLAGRALVCGAHQWTYNACTGRGLDPNDVELCALPVSIEGDHIVVELPGDGPPGDIIARVGPVLRAGPAAQAIVAAIRDLNPDVQVLDRGAHLRVLALRACLVTRAAIEARLRAPFRLPGDLEAVMPSFQGSLYVTADDARWEG